jgi:RNA polymerase sigma-70 factor (ECF subfamily)
VKKQEGRAYVGIDEPEVDEFEQLKVPATAHQQVEAVSNRERITKILDSMSKTLRIPLILCDMDELSYEEVAQTLGISLSAAKMRIKRAREEFKNLYGKQAAVSMEVRG